MHSVATALSSSVLLNYSSSVKPGNPKVRAPATDWTGQTLFGKWKVERLIGIGGTATVLQARHRNGRRAALKVLHPHLASHGRTRERFLREGRLANLVNHPGVVAVLDDFMTDDGAAVLVLELVQGQTLAALAKASGGVLDPREVVAAACAMLDILAVAHDANVIHRDVKPENILRCADGAHKLADFGLAALHHELGMLTGTNMALGTPAYMSPEQARGDAHQVDARTDIWSLGATMFTLLTGRYLHAASTPKNLVVAAATEPAPAILSLEPDMHPPLAAIIDRAVRMDKEARWPNARAMLAELRGIDVPDSDVHPRSSVASGDDTAAMSTVSSFMSWTHPGSWLRRTERRSKRWLVGALLGIGMTSVSVLVWLRAATAPATRGDASSEVQTENDAGGTRVAPIVALPLTQDPIVPHPRTTQDALIGAQRPAKREFVGRARSLARTTAAIVPSSTPQATASATERELSVPDEVLDRRE